MTTAERLLKVDKGIDKVEALNEELATSLYGGDTGYRGHYDEFWDAYQNYGKYNGNCNGAFSGVCWNEQTFKPKYDLKGFWGATNLFGSNQMSIDLPAYLEALGITLDFSSVTHASTAFSYSKFTRLGAIDLRKATTASGVFSYMPNLVTIDKIIVSENTAIQTWFTEDFNLENVIFEGEIAKSGLSLQWCTKLSKASIISIINALSTTTSGKSVTLSRSAVDRAFVEIGGFTGSYSAEWNALISTRPNWTISLI